MMRTGQDATVLIELDGQRWALEGLNSPEGATLRRLRSQEHPYGPVVHVTDFGGALQGVEQVSTARRYAAPIIEKLLRDRGDAEGTSRVLVLDSETRAGATRALYHAVPTDRYEEYRKLAASHGDHHLQLSHLTLLLHLARRRRERVVGVLFQHGRHVDVLITLEGSPRACFRVTASGTAFADWQRALGFLTQELRSLQNRMEMTVERLVWVDWNPGEGTGTEALRQWLAEHSGLAVVPEPAVSISHEHGTLESALPVLVQQTPLRRAINPPLDRVLWAGERLLPWAAVVMVGISAALALAGMQWQGQARAHEASLQVMEGQYREVDQQAIRAHLREAVALPAADTVFVDRIATASALPSLAAVVADIRQVMPETGRLTRLSLDREGGEARLIVEGWVDAAPQQLNSAVEQIIVALMALGHTVRDNGLMSREQRNLFQLELDLEEYHGEV